MNGSIKLLLGLLLLHWSAAAIAGDEHIAPQQFIERVFGGVAPASNTVWLTGETKDVAAAILGHKPDYLRLRYWGDDDRSAWIVDEIGKTEPITIGVIVRQGQIEEIKVLAFRESRGWEIKHEFFTRQFRGIAIGRQQLLDRDIDGISGATLSVKAMKNVSRLVLYLAESIST